MATTLYVFRMAIDATDGNTARDAYRALLPELAARYGGAATAEYAYADGGTAPGYELRVTMSAPVPDGDAFFTGWDAEEREAALARSLEAIAGRRAALRTYGREGEGAEPESAYRNARAAAGALRGGR
jgi:hypothetical protein